MQNHLPTISFNDEEQRLLVELLDSELRELSPEIHYTDDHDYQQALKEKERVRKELLMKVQAAS